MRFASSRLLTLGVLTGAFALHAACGGSVDVNFVGASGASGGNGATSGKGGSNSGKGGSNSSGGDNSAAGDGANAGNGNSSNTGGDQGTAGAVGQAGDGFGGAPPNCPDFGPEDCADGIDNDCNGRIDCLVLNSAFPEDGKASAAEHVVLDFEPPFADADFQCRAARPDDLAAAPWASCDGGPTVSPLDEALTADPGYDGLKVIQVRLAFPGPVYSDVFVWHAYIHHSLNGLDVCGSVDRDGDYFETAQIHLPPAGTFGATAKLDNPFIHLEFDPPVDSWLGISDADGTINAMSLRKRFVRDPTDEYVLMSRVFESKSNGSCGAATLFVHYNQGSGNANTTLHPRCTALVFNKTGAGVCLADVGGVITLMRPNNTSYFTMPTYTGGTDALLWRELRRPTHTGYQRYFSPKCITDPTCVSEDSNLD